MTKSNWSPSKAPDISHLFNVNAFETKKFGLELEKLNRKRNDFVKNEKTASRKDAEWMVKEIIKLKLL